MKTITVSECLDCPYVKSSQLTEEVAYCHKIGKSITDLGSIPSWCRLPETPLAGRSNKKACFHHWVDAKNAVIESGRYCTKCHEIADDA